MSRKQKIYPWLIVIFSGILCGVIADTYTSIMSLFLTPLVTAIHAPLSSVSFFMTINIISMSVGFVLVGKLINKVPFNLAISIAVAITAVAVWVLSRATSLPIVYLAAIVVGLGSGTTGYIVQGILVDNWFIEKKNFAFSACAFVDALYLVFASWLTTVLINQYGWRNALFTLAIISLIGGLICGNILKLKPESINLKPYGANKKHEEAEGEEGAQLHISSKSVVLSITFFIVLMFFVLDEFAGNINSLLPTFAEKVGFGATAGGVMLTIGNFANMIITPIFGITTDKWGSKAIMGWLVVGMAAMGLFIIAGQSHSLPLLYTAGFLGATFGTLMGTGEQVFGAEMFGPAFDIGYSHVSAVTSLISAFSTPAFSLIYEKTGSFNAVFITIIVIAAIVLLLTIIGPKFKFVNTKAMKEVEAQND